MDEHEDMVVDFDLESNPIQDFLNHKLQEVRLQNQELQDQIERRKETIDQCVKKVVEELQTDSISKNYLEISSVWQRVVDHTLVFGIEISNNHHKSAITNIEPILKWNSRESLMYSSNVFSNNLKPKYQVRNQSIKHLIEELECSSSSNNDNLFDEEWLKTASIFRNGVLVLSKAIPDFIITSKYLVSGIIMYSIEDKTYQKKLCDIEIDIEELCKEDDVVTKSKVIAGSPEAYLSLVCAHQETHLVIKINDNNPIDIESMFEFECKFYRAAIISSTRSYFYVDNLVAFVNGSFIILERKHRTTYFVRIYSKDKKCLQVLLHHINKNVPNIFFLPYNESHHLEDHLENFSGFNDDLDSSSHVKQSTLKYFAQSLERQIDYIQEFFNKCLDEVPEEVVNEDDCVNLNVEIKEYQKFRIALSDLELVSDRIYEKFD